jgi:hypothetical protein
MPRGFSGGQAAKYLGQVSDAHTRAAASGSQIATNAPSNANLRTRQLPFGPEDAMNGGAVATGRGNSSNIVASQREYEAVSNRVSQADDRVGECVYSISNDIEALCQTAFILPTAAPRCLNVSDDVKRSLGQFRAMTEDVIAQARVFARDITGIGL